MTTFAIAGCHDRYHVDPNCRSGEACWPQYDLAAPQPTDDGFVASDDGGTTLGSGRGEPAASTPLHVLANGEVDFSTGQLGFAVTADGKGGYRVAWVDTSNANFRYHGSIFCNGTFSQITSVGMKYATANGNRLDFESQPNGGTSGYVDFVSSVDPIVVDALDGASGGTIYYVDGSNHLRSAPTPATFTSP